MFHKLAVSKKDMEMMKIFIVYAGGYFDRFDRFDFADKS